MNLRLTIVGALAWAAGCGTSEARLTSPAAEAAPAAVAAPATAPAEAPASAPDTATAPAAAEAPLLLFSTPLPKDGELSAEPGPDAKLPIRITLTTRVADATVKVYVGQRLIGRVGTEETAATWARVEEIAREIIATGTIDLEVDAMSEASLQHVLEAAARGARAGARRISFSASAGEWAWTPPAGGLDAVAPASAELPSVSAGSSPMAGADQALALALTGDALAVRPPGGAWTAVGAEGFVAAIKVHADRERDPARPALSRSQIVIHAAGEARWGRLQLFLQECAMAGIWDIAFAVRPADGPR